MKRLELCEWLRSNSSGVYRNSALAADYIEHLESKLVGITHEPTYCTEYQWPMKKLAYEGLAFFNTEGEGL